MLKEKISLTYCLGDESGCIINDVRVNVKVRSGNTHNYTWPRNTVAKMMSIARTVARQCCVCCGVHEEELKPGILSNYRTWFDHTTFSTTQQKHWFRYETVWLLYFQTVRCYMNASLQIMKRSRTWCIYGFIHNCKRTQQMLSGGLWARVKCWEVVGLVSKWLCICPCVPCVK